MDNLVLRAGYRSTIDQVRQAGTYGHIRVDGHRVDKPCSFYYPRTAMGVGGALA
ncbi:MAG TPA: S4 domain-containing protein [Jiangellales bacterium]|nr:S4 domain-containing protein [Jiangellales bacterium]